ncbi:MAG: hypothetical protein AB4426_26815 [Xenococcaceae cyanobacterium]
MVQNRVTRLEGEQGELPGAGEAGGDGETPDSGTRLKVPQTKTPIVLPCHEPY